MNVFSSTSTPAPVGDWGVIVLVDHIDVLLECAAHHQPHDCLDALGAGASIDECLRRRHATSQ